MDSTMNKKRAPALLPLTNIPRSETVGTTDLKIPFPHLVLTLPTVHPSSIPLFADIAKDPSTGLFGVQSRGKRGSVWVSLHA